MSVSILSARPERRARVLSAPRPATSLCTQVMLSERVTVTPSDEICVWPACVCRSLCRSSTSTGPATGRTTRMSCDRPDRRSAHATDPCCRVTRLRRCASQSACVYSILSCVGYTMFRPTRGLSRPERPAAAPVSNDSNVEASHATSRAVRSAERGEPARASLSRAVESGGGGGDDATRSQPSPRSAGRHARATSLVGRRSSRPRRDPQTSRSDLATLRSAQNDARNASRSATPIAA